MSVSPGPAILASATENYLIVEPRSRVGLRSISSSRVRFGSRTVGGDGKTISTTNPYRIRTVQSFQNPGRIAKKSVHRDPNPETFEHSLPDAVPIGFLFWCCVAP